MLQVIHFSVCASATVKEQKLISTIRFFSFTIYALVSIFSNKDLEDGISLQRGKVACFDINLYSLRQLTATL